MVFLNEFFFLVKNLEEGKLDSLNEEEFLKAQENQENPGEDGKDLGLGGLDAGGLMKFGGSK